MIKPLKSFECRIEDYFSIETYRQHGIRNLVSNHVAKSSSSARYKFWQEHQDGLPNYGKCLTHIKVKSLGRMKPEHLFGDTGQFKSMCEKRNIPFCYMGMIVDVSGKKGWIVGSNSHLNLDVLFEGLTYTQNCHPTYETTYYDNKGNIIKDFKNKN